MLKNGKFILIFFITFLSLSLIPQNGVQAASTTYDFFNDFGMRYEFTATISSVFPKTGLNSIDFRITLKSLRPIGVRLYNILVSFRIADLLLEGSTSSSASSFNYDPAWGEIDLEIEVTYTEELSGHTDLHGLTAWLSFFTLKSGSFITENYYILIIVGVVVILGSIGSAMIFRRGGMSKSNEKIIQDSLNQKESMESSIVQQEQTEEAPKTMKFCPHCVADLKGATQTCPSCGIEL